MKRTPVCFIGHGSPMNAVAVNPFTGALRKMRALCPAPRAILCVSAHWMTEGTWITRMEHPRTIHDFYGFPQELFDIRYPAPGSPEIADLVISTVGRQAIHADEQMWGLDHGTWSVLRHIYPEAKIPVLQLSLHLQQPARYHYELGTRLRSLRDQGVLIVGSGNVVHNLRKIRWEEDAEPFPWAVEFDEWIKARLQARDAEALMNDFNATEAGRLSVPTVEHYLPLLYVLGASDESDQLKTEFEGIQNGSISMRTVSFSRN
jgi:4,5-DOPA dioxygenase extradiol